MYVTTKSVEQSLGTGSKQRTGSDRIPAHLVRPDCRRKPADMRCTRIGHVKRRLIGREGQSIWLYAVRHDERYSAGATVDPVDVGGADLGFALPPLIVAVDSVGRVGEPDRAIRFDHHIVGRIQSAPLILVGKDGDGTIVL